MNKNLPKGRLFLIPNIIAEDTSGKVISPQTLRIVPEIKHFLVENIRTARRFISSLRLGITIEELEFEVLDKKTRPQALAEMMEPLNHGLDIGVISESGCPGIADPGSLAVTYAHKHSIEVVPVSGPSSLFLALMASGFNGQTFKFHGYLPVKPAERVKAIRELEKESAMLRQTQLFIETPYRNDHLLRDLVMTCQKDTFLCVGYGLTGEQEKIISKPIAEWKKEPFTIGKIPAVFLIYVSS